MQVYNVCKSKQTIFGFKNSIFYNNIKHTLIKTCVIVKIGFLINFFTY